MFFGDIMLILINKILWFIATLFIVYSGIYFLFYLKGIQFNLKCMLKSFKLKKEKKEISSFKTLMMVLAGRIGVGSIAGVALAIHMGGIGSIFWLWITAFIGASNSFVETILGMKYREKDSNDINMGGPSFYIKNGLKKNKLSKLYSLIIILSYVVGFLSIQSNTIYKSLSQIFNISPIIIGLVISILTSFIIFGGVKKIADFSGKLVPFMTIGYVLITLFICIYNLNKIPNIIINIIKEAFNIKSFFGGFISTFIVGIQRGIFSNEAGIGTGAIASSIVDDDNILKQGYLQVIGIYITTLIICTSTAMVILLSPYETLNLTNINGIEITQFAFQYHLGEFGNIIVFISIILFSFTTILTGYYDGEVSLKFLLSNFKQKYILILKICTLIILFIGCIISSEKIWLFVDILVAIQAIINIYALLKLKYVVKKEIYK